MSGTNQQSAEVLVSQARSLGDSTEKVRLLEEALRQAAASRDESLEFDVRMQLVNAATFAGQSDKALVAFVWCLSRFDQDPKRFAAHQFELSWYFKYVLNHICEFPNISLAEIQNVQTQMESWYQRHGYSMRPVFQAKMVSAMHLGRRDAMREAFPLWQNAPRDRMADCSACEQSNAVSYWVALQEFDKALDAAQPLLAGEMSCACVPHSTIARVLRPLVYLDQREEALQLHRRGYRMIRHRRVFVDVVPEHIAFLLHQHNFSRALALFERHFEWAWDTGELDARFRNWAAAHALFARLADGSRKTCKLRLPREFPLQQPSGEYDTGELAAWFRREADALGECFNRRNGNRYFTDVLAKNYCY